MNDTVRTDVVFVDKQVQLDASIEVIAQTAVVGFDTEFVGEATYESQLCLLQVNSGDRIFIIDPLAPLEMAAFWQALTAPDREVIALAARQELLFCLKYAGRTPGRVFDPQLGAGLVGLGYPLSHTNLTQRVLGVRVKGGETFTDWRKRPLTASQLEYAAEDVRHLLAVREALLKRAADLSREHWLEVENASMVQRLVEGQDEERWFRVSGAGRLSRRELAILRNVWQWRDDTARRQDIPARRVMSDDLMIQIVRRGPSTPSDLLQLRGMDRYRRDAEGIVAAVVRGKEVPQSELPELLSREDPQQVQVLAQLASIVTSSLAAEQEVDVSLLATTADLQAVVRWKLGLAEEKPRVLEGWRGAILGEPLVALLEGRSTIRVTDVRSRSPLRIESLV